MDTTQILAPYSFSTLTAAPGGGVRDSVSQYHRITREPLELVARMRSTVVAPVSLRTEGVMVDLPGIHADLGRIAFGAE
jgi:hypothetical protein